MKRLNLIEEQLASLDFATAPGFVVNGLKREQLVAMNSMILHEVFFDGLGEESQPGSELVDALARDFGSFEAFSDVSTVVMIALMWIGRLELIPVLVLLTRSYWRA